MATYRPMRSCRIGDDIYLKAKYIAEQENRSFNNFLEVLLKKTIAAYEAEHGEIKVDTDALYE